MSNTGRRSSRSQRDAHRADMRARMDAVTSMYPDEVYWWHAWNRAARERDAQRRQRGHRRT